MKNPFQTVRSPEWISATLAAVGFVGYIASRSPNTLVAHVTFILSLAAMIGGAVILTATLLRAVMRQLGASVAAVAATFRHFVGIGLYSGLAHILWSVGFSLAMISWNPDGDRQFTLVEIIFAAVGAFLFFGLGWPIFLLRRFIDTETLLDSTFPVLPFCCALINGLLLYAGVLVFRRLKSKISGIALVVLLALLTGCRGMGTQRFEPYAPSQADNLARSSRVVLDVRCTKVAWEADYTLWENLQMLAPMPKRWKADATFEVERVVQGEFSEPALEVHWLRSATPEQSTTLGIPYRGWHTFTNGMPLRVGFDFYSGKHLRNLRLMIRDN